jgi:hypothetical protein
MTGFAGAQQRRCGLKKRKSVMTVKGVAVGLIFFLPVGAMSQQIKVDDGFVQGRFAQAYNRKDVEPWR